MSYAHVAAKNPPPPELEGHPTSNSLLVERPDVSRVVDDVSKVNIVPSDFKENPVTVTSLHNVPGSEDEYEDSEGANKGKKQNRKKLAKRRVHEFEEEAEGVWEYVKDLVLRPGVAGGLLGVVNVGLIGFAGYSLYNEPHLRSDRQFLTTTSVGFLALFGLEGYAAERYVQTPEGRAEREKAKKEGAAILRHSKEVVLRPGVLGGLVGVANLGVLGGVGYAAYTNWDKPAWDRRVVTAVTVGLLGLWGGEGVLAEKYRERYLEE